jgi:hypothetical protein
MIEMTELGGVVDGQEVTSEQIEKLLDFEHRYWRDSNPQKVMMSPNITEMAHPFFDDKVTEGIREVFV